MKSARLAGIWLCLATLAAYGQSVERAPGRTGASHSNSVLGPGDVISIKAAEADEINAAAIRIDPSGVLHLPLVGRIQTEGMTVEQLESVVKAGLRPYVKQPEVSISVVEYHNQPVSVLGAVANPGVHQVQGYKTLAEVLALAGGLRQDAGYSIRITRRAEWGPIPLPNAVYDSTKKFSVAEVGTTALVAAANPAENIQILPNDIITVPRAEMVYVQGQVRRPGGYVLHDKEHMSVLVAMSLAEGFDRLAAPHNARILRVVPGETHREELAIDLKRILDGKAGDFMMQAEDILFVPGSMSKAVTMRTIESAVQIGTGLAVFGR